jgi:polyhydroxybutyrate depolymerase
MLAAVAYSTVAFSACTGGGVDSHRTGGGAGTTVPMAGMAGGGAGAGGSAGGGGAGGQPSGPVAGNMGAAGDAGAGSGTAGAVGGAGVGGTGGSGNQPPDGGQGGAGGLPDITAMWPGRMMPTGQSAGCGMVPAQALAMYVKHDIVVTKLDASLVAMYGKRNYYLRLPTAYSPTHVYPLVFLGPGCGGNGSQVIPLQDASKGDAILVGLSPVGGCFQTNGAASPEIPFFDAVLAEVEANTCVDRARVFVAGFSSGSWLANNLGCPRAGIIRGQGNATGGEPGNQGTCTGPIAAMMAHDTTDTANKIEWGEAARDRMLKTNGCGTDTEPYDAGTPSPCVIYKGCMPGYPVVWCQTTGKGHSDQIPISTIGFWKFWSSLP